MFESKTLHVTSTAVILFFSPSNLQFLKLIPVEYHSRLKWLQAFLCPLQTVTVTKEPQYGRMQICQIFILPDTSHFFRFCLGWLDPKIPSGNHQTSGLWNLTFVASVMVWPNTLPMKCSLPGFNIDLQNDSALMGDEVWWAGEHKKKCMQHKARLLLTEDSSAGSLILSLLLISDAHLILRPRQVSI